MSCRVAVSSVAVICLAGCTPMRDAPTYRPRALDRANSIVRNTPAVATQPAAALGQQSALSLNDCIEIALKSNRRISIADRRVLIARDRVSEAIAMTMPQLSVEGRFTSRNNDSGIQRPAPSLRNQLRQSLTQAAATSLVEQAGLTPTGQFLQPTGAGPSFSGTFSERDVWTSRVSLIVPIYDFGRSEFVRQVQEGRVQTARYDARRERQDVAFAVSQSYYRILEAEKIKRVVEESIRVVERQLEIARDFQSQGLVAANDVLAAEVQLAERRQQLSQAENNIQLAIATLNRQIGADVTEPTTVVDVLEVEPWRGRFTDALMLAIGTRPDLASVRRQIEIARDEYRATRAEGTAPRIFGFADYNWSSDEFLLNNEWLSGGVAVQIPIFDGGVTIARLQRQRKEIAETVDRYDEQVDNIVLDIKQSYLNVNESAGRIPVARKAVELGEENLRIVRDQYGEGLLTSADVLTEEDRLSQARSNYYQSLYDYHSSYARLVHAIGGEPPAETQGP
ncbi:MAG: TolC family protein [Phycisphaerae bacterium]|nr:TolC family protein [Phycisphaerae bacterium]